MGRASIVQRTSYLVPKDLDARYDHRTNYFETFVHILKGNIGAGLFAMGDALKHSGILLGIVFVMCIGMICIYNQHLLVLLSKGVREMKLLPRNPTFTETIASAFELGSPGFTRARKVVKIVMMTCILLTQFGFCVVYITFVSGSMQTLVETQTDYRMNTRLYMLATAPVLYTCSLLHTLKFLAPVSAISTFLLLYGWGVVVIYCSLDLPDLSSRSLLAPPGKWPLAVGTIIFAYEGIALVIPIRNEMKEPHKFDGVFGILNFGMTICTAMYLSAGLIGYWKYGDDVEGSMTFNLSSHPVAESARICVGLGILLTYPLQFYVPIKLIFRIIKVKWGPFKKPLLVELLLRTVMVTVTYIFALAIPRVDIIISFIGAVCCNALALFFPALSDISLRCNDSSSEEVSVEQRRVLFPKSAIRFIMDVLSIVLSILGAVFGLWISTKAMIEHIEKEIKKNMEA